MPLVKKSQMSAKQVDDLTNFKKSMSEDGWESEDSFDSFFEGDMFVPVQASFRKNSQGTELSARYSANAGADGGYIMLDYTKDDDYKTVEVSFDNTSTSIVNFICSSLEQARTNGIRSVLENMILQRFEAKVNFYDSYLPLTTQNLDDVYNHVYEIE
jgi:hypothetical protein